MELLVIGNGFDKALGHKTQYGEFMWLVNLCLNQNDKKKFLLECKNFFNFDADEEILFDFKNSVCSLRENYFLKYFISFTNTVELWCDFEEVLFNIIKSFDNLFTVLKEGDYDKDYYFGNNEFSVPNRRLEKAVSFLLFNAENKFFKITDQSIYQKKYSGTLFTFNNDFFTSSHLDRIQLLERVYKEFPMKLHNELSEFSMCFSKFLKIQENMFPSLPFSSFNGRFDVGISYNYTQYGDLFLTKEESKLYHIHGTIKNNNIVIGINNDSEIKNDEFLIFTKLSTRLSSEVFYNIDAVIPPLPLNSVSIIGHSLNLADKDTLSSIFKKCSNSTIIYLYYFYEGNSKIEELNAKQKLYKNLLKIIQGTKVNIGNVIPRKSNSFFN